MGTHGEVHMGWFGRRSAGARGVELDVGERVVAMLSDVFVHFDDVGLHFDDVLVTDHRVVLTRRRQVAQIPIDEIAGCFAGLVRHGPEAEWGLSFEHRHSDGVTHIVIPVDRAQAGAATTIATAIAR
jgi:hypothetical protein